MPLLQDLLPRHAITGVEPFNELPVDAEIWREAHQHHHLHRLLHAAIAHRPGIVWGLEVIASGKSGGVLVAPGVGVDAGGQTVVLTEPVFLTLEERGQIHITLSFLRTFDRASATPVGGGQQYFRLVEGRDVRATKDVGNGPFLELARIYRTAPDAPVTDASAPFDPVNNELNLLGRVPAFPFCFADAPVGELAYVPQNDPAGWKPNRAGLVQLSRESAGAGFHCAFLGPVNLRDAALRVAPSFLYAAGRSGFQSLASEEVDGLRAFLDSGGVLLGESTGAATGETVETSDGFFAAFNDLARQIGANLAPLAPDHPLYATRFVFAQNHPPLGGSEPNGTSFLGDDAQGIYWSGHNWGGAWQGRVPNASGEGGRERIRASLEWGMNFLAWAAQRKRRKELARML